MPSKQQRILGALLGVHAGDSLGATVEFDTWDAIHRHFPNGLRDIIGGGSFDWAPGHATDDTDMTRAVLLAYQDQAGEDGDGTALRLAQAAGHYMLDWFDGRCWPGRKPSVPPVDVGGATRRGLAAFRETGDARCAGAGRGQAGNGSLMRCIPTALFGGGPSRRLQESALLSAVTHDDARCVLACAAYNAMAHQLAVAGATPPDAVAAGLAVVQDENDTNDKNDQSALQTIAASLAVQSPSRTRTQDQWLARLAEHRQAVVRAIEHGQTLSVRDVATLGPKAAPGGPEAIPREAGGYVLESLTLAVAAVLDKRCLEDVLVDVVRVGRDTDTNGAIAGGLLGARDGVGAIPTRWREKLQFNEEFTGIVKKLVDEEEQV